MNKPNFFILGSARCGTTYLYRLLRQHPDVFMSHVKEPSYFGTQFRVIKTSQDYLKLFEPATTQLAIGEASHVYMTDPSVPDKLHAEFSNAKFVIILRNPTNRAYSLYHWMRKHKYEDINTFEDALLAEEVRYYNYRRRFDIPWCKQYIWNYMYIRSSRYHEQIVRYLRLYPLCNFHILSLEELINTPKYQLQRIFKFLNIDSKFLITPEYNHKPSKYPPMNDRTRLKLDLHFNSTVSSIESLVRSGFKIGKV